MASLQMPVSSMDTEKHQQCQKRKLGKYNLMGFEVIIYMPSENQTKKISLVL